MWRNYLNIALRNLLRNRVHTLINLTGLSLGISCTLLMVLYVQDEVNYDAHHLKGDRIYRISSDMRMGTKEDLFALTSLAVGERLMAEYPELDTFVRFRMALTGCQSGMETSCIMKNLSPKLIRRYSKYFLMS
ncbi:MAG: ABC transporter permease [Bacteroidia bacterium]